MTLVVELMPDWDRLVGGATVRECNDQRCIFLQHSANFAQHFHWPGQVVDRDADAGPVEFSLSERQFGICVQVLDHVGVEPLVAAQLHLVHPEPDHSPVYDLRRQMAYPTAHQVENLVAWWKELPI
ncbi:MAG: hypothetical protein ACR2FR_01035 [Rubrobacter sp.]